MDALQALIRNRAFSNETAQICAVRREELRVALASNSSLHPSVWDVLYSNKTPVALAVSLVDQPLTPEAQLRVASKERRLNVLLALVKHPLTEEAGHALIANPKYTTEIARRWVQSAAVPEALVPEVTRRASGTLFLKWVRTLPLEEAYAELRSWTAGGDTGWRRELAELVCEREQLAFAVLENPSQHMHTALADTPTIRFPEVLAAVTEKQNLRASTLRLELSLNPWTPVSFLSAYREKEREEFPGYRYGGGRQVADPVEERVRAGWQLRCAPEELVEEHDFMVATGWLSKSTDPELAQWRLANLPTLHSYHQVTNATLAKVITNANLPEAAARFLVPQLGIYATAHRALLEEAYRRFPSLGERPVYAHRREVTPTPRQLPAPEEVLCLQMSDIRRWHWGAAQVMCSLLNEKFADVEAKWETMISLAPSFNGTVSEMLELVEMLQVETPVA